MEVTNFMDIEKKKSRVTPEISADLKRINEVDNEIEQLRTSIEYRQLNKPYYDPKELEMKIEELRKEKEYLLDKLTKKT